MLKVLVANSHRGIVGGAERYLQAIVPELLARGYQVGIVHTYAHDAANPTIDPPEAAVPVWCLDGFNSTAVLQDIRRWGPSLVFGHGLEPDHLERQLAGDFPFVAFLHDYSHTCPTGRKYQLLPNIHCCSRTAGPVCLLLHYPLRCGGLNPKRAWLNYQKQQRRMETLSVYRYVLVASRHMYNEVAAHAAGIEERLKVVSLPATSVKARPTPPEPKTPAGCLMVTGRLTDVKGVDVLLHAMPVASAKLEMPLKLVVAGSGSELDRLKALANNLHVAAEFKGWLNTGEVSHLMAQSDVVAVPSLWPEPFGLVGIEAGCVGTPAVGFALGGITEWLIDGETGELAPGQPPTAAGLGDAIWRALRDPEHYHRLRMGAWLNARKRSLSAHADELDKVFAMTLSRPAASAVV